MIHYQEIAAGTRAVIAGKRVRRVGEYPFAWAEIIPFIEKGNNRISTVRFFGGGIPQVFCDGNDASEQRFQELINWGKA